MIEDSINYINKLILDFDQEGGFYLQSKISSLDWSFNKVLKDFYCNYGPEENTSFEVGGSVLYFHAKEKIEPIQMVYNSFDDAAPVPSWETVVVIALYNDDPVAVNIGSERAEVYAAYESGQLNMISSSFDEFFKALHSVMNIQYKSFGLEVLDEETFELKTEFMESVVKSLEEFMDVSHRNNFIDFFFG